MKKTVFLVVLAVLVLAWLPTLVEAKFITEKLANNWYLITEIPDDLKTETLPPLPQNIKLNIKEVTEAYQFSSIGKSYPYTETMSAITSFLPPTFKSRTLSYEISLTKNEDNDGLKWDIKPPLKSEGVSKIGIGTSILLLLMLFAILSVGIYDRRFSQRKTIFLFGFYFFTLFSSATLFIPLTILDVATKDLPWMISLVVAWGMLIWLGKIPLRGLLPVFASINLLIDAVFYMIILSFNGEINSPWELFTILAVTVVISFFIGEKWYHWNKNHQITTSAMTQTT